MSIASVVTTLREDVPVDVDIRPQVCNGSLQVLAALPVLSHFESFGQIPTEIRKLVEAGALRLLDSDMIITQSEAMPSDAVADVGTSSELRHTETALAEAVLAKIEAEGLADHFKPFMRSFIRIMFNLFFTQMQYERACQFLDDGYHFSFLMSDAGGPSLASWRSVARPSDDGIRLTVDKVWGIEAHREGIAVVAARLPGGFFPAAYLVWPEKYRSLQRSAYGDPFLDGRLQLGNAKGEVTISPDDRLKIGGPTVFNKYLTVVRPFFVRALMAHVEWLKRSGNATLDADDETIRHFIADFAKKLTHDQRYDVEKVNKVMALKFISNEFLISLVRKNSIAKFTVQRDLLAFSKMEGSSYHCYKTLRASFKGI